MSPVSARVVFANRTDVAFGFFFFNDTATTEIYTLSLHDALPISAAPAPPREATATVVRTNLVSTALTGGTLGYAPRSEEHTSELQSQSNLVCRLLLEKKNIWQPDPQSC